MLNGVEGDLKGADCDCLPGQVLAQGEFLCEESLVAVDRLPDLGQPLDATRREIDWQLAGPMARHILQSEADRYEVHVVIRVQM